MAMRRFGMLAVVLGAAIGVAIAGVGPGAADSPVRSLTISTFPGGVTIPTFGPIVTLPPGVTIPTAGPTTTLPTTTTTKPGTTATTKGGGGSTATTPTSSPSGACIVAVEGTQKVKRKKVRVKILVQASESVIANAQGTFKGRAKVKVKAANVQIPAGETKSLTLKGKAKRKGTAKGIVTVACTDAAGAVATFGGDVKLKVR